MRKARANNLNPGAGALFEKQVQRVFFNKFKIKLENQMPFQLGIGKTKKEHKFDLVSTKNRLIVECKSYTWTISGNFPSAKFGALNELMFYFSLAPKNYRKILVMKKHMKKGVSLAHHYVKTNPHLISRGVEIWEMAKNNAERVY